MRLIACIAATVLLSACGSSGFDSPLAPAPAPAPPPAATVEFSSFVVSEIGNTSDEREPVEINGLEFEFGEDTNAFIGLFPAGE